MPPARDELTAALRRLGASAALAAQLRAFLKARHPGDQERIYHSLAHTLEVAALTARMLRKWPRVPAERKVLILLAAALHDLDPERCPGTPARVQATLEYLQNDEDAHALIAAFCDRFHFTPGQVGALIMATDYSAHPEEMAELQHAFKRAHKYAFGDDPWIDEWGRRLAYWDKIATYLHNTPEESRRRVAGLGRELRTSGAWRRRPKAGLKGVSRAFLEKLTRDPLFDYLSKADRARFRAVLRRF